MLFSVEYGVVPRAPTDSPNQVLTHAARAAAKQPLCGRARRAKGSGQSNLLTRCNCGAESLFCYRDIYESLLFDYCRK